MITRTPSAWAAVGLAGTVLGFTLALILSALFVLLAPEGPGKVQMAMWLVGPAWLAALSAAFLCRDGTHAWMWLGGANGVAYTVLSVSRHLLG